MPNQMSLIRRPSSLWVDRGPTNDYDFDEDDLNPDNNQHDLDLSAIVPSGATWVLLSISLNLVTGTYVTTMWGKGGLLILYNCFFAYADLTVDWFYDDAWLQLSPGRTVRYYIDTDGTIGAEISVRGWVI